MEKLKTRIDDVFWDRTLARTGVAFGVLSVANGLLSAYVAGTEHGPTEHGPLSDLDRVFEDLPPSIEVFVLTTLGLVGIWFSAQFLAVSEPRGHKDRY